MGYIVIRKGVSRPIPGFAPLETLLLYVKCVHTHPVLLLVKLLYVAKHWVAGAMSGNLIQKPPPLRRSYYTSGHLLHTHNWSVFVEYLPCTRKIHML